MQGLSLGYRYRTFLTSGCFKHVDVGFKLRVQVTDLLNVGVVVAWYM